MKRSRIRRRNPERRPADAASLQRAVVLERSGYACEFEIRLDTDHIWGEPEAWARCRSEVVLQAAHIFRRRHHPDAAVYDPDVAIAACRKHHLAWDAHERDGLRFPPGAEARARLAINRSVTTFEARLKDGEPP